MIMKGMGAAALSLASVAVLGQTPQPAGLPAEMPEKFVATLAGYDYEKRDLMIPMRDGVKLHAVAIVRKGLRDAPIIMDRTPYNAAKRTHVEESVHATSVVRPALAELIEAGYILVLEDVRGKYKSEGDYVMNRPLRGTLNPTAVDHATDTFDTIDWLVKNVPESNGRVGLIGVSYDGFTVTQGLVDPHPALKAAVPINPMIDGWMGDDWFHNGAFRQEGMSYIYDQQATRANDADWPIAGHDDYDLFLRAGSAGALARSVGMDQLGFWTKLVAHPAYDAWWQAQAVDRILAARPLAVPTLWVHSLWDQEDIYGAPAAYAATEPKDAANDRNYLVIGPWRHGGSMASDGPRLGAIDFGSDTAEHFRKHILLPFLDAHLKTAAPAADIAPVMAFETGTNEWRRLPAWPPRDAMARNLYLHADFSANFAAPTAAKEFDEFVSDPAKPVPYRLRPNRPMSADDSTWGRWLVDDQRPFSDRTDVLTYVSEPLTEPLHVAGRPQVDLFASTSGSDADWIVKLIDVYPDEYFRQPELGGYQLAVAMDAFRGRYRESPGDPKPLKPNAPLEYRFSLPTANHVFLPGHRVMVQIQSSWFPLYDRNPQTYVANIFNAEAGAYRKAVHRVFAAADLPSHLVLPVVH